MGKVSPGVRRLLVGTPLLSNPDRELWAEEVNPRWWIQIIAHLELKNPF